MPELRMLRLARRKRISFVFRAVIRLGLALGVFPGVAPAAEKMPAAGEIAQFEVSGERVSAYMARPKEGGGGHPGVVVLHERWGLNDQIKGVADKLAALGYTTLAPDLFDGKLPSDAGWAHQFETDLKEDRALRIIEGAIAFLRSQPDARDVRVGVLGFGLGGHLSLLTALKGADIQAVALFYGKVETSRQALAKLRTPLLGIFGRDDRIVPRAEAEEFRTALKEGGKTATIVVFADAQHDFFNEDRPSYNAENSVGAWAHTTQFFAEHLKPAPLGAPPASPAPGSGR